MYSESQSMGVSERDVSFIRRRTGTVTKSGTPENRTATSLTVTPQNGKSISSSISCLSHSSSSVNASEAKEKTAPKLRKSCNLCVLRKTKCDGDGSKKCSLCVSKKRPCHYTARKVAGPRGPYRTKAKKLREAVLLAKNGCSQVDQDGRTQPSSADGLRMKRARFGASPATGLVGTPENAFLGVYFRCMGFLSLISASNVREGMVSTMLSPTYSNGMLFHHAVPDYSSNHRLSMTENGAMRQAGRMRVDGTVIDASKCAFWCAVGIGALIQGEPAHEAMPFVRLASACLSECFDQDTPEVARGYTAMAYLHNFLRQDNQAYHYFNLAKSINARLPDQAIPQVITDLVMRGLASRAYHDPNASHQQIKDFIDEDLPQFQKPVRLISLGGLCQYFIQCDNLLLQAFLRDAADQKRSKDVGISDRSGGARISENGGFGLRSEREREKSDFLTDEGGDGKGKGHDKDERYSTFLMSTNIQDFKECQPISAGSSNGVISEMENFSAMKEAAESLEVGGGVGGLLFNSLAAYLKFVREDPDATCQPIMNCAHILLAYPGLCRSSNWLHLAHCVLALLYGHGQTALYGMLRQAFNSVCLFGMSDIPPMETTTGEAWDVDCLCDNIFCRYICKIAKEIFAKRKRTDETLLANVVMRAATVTTMAPPTVNSYCMAHTKGNHSAVDMISTAVDTGSYGTGAKECDLYSCPPLTVSVTKAIPSTSAALYSSSSSNRSMVPSFAPQLPSCPPSPGVVGPSHGSSEREMLEKHVDKHQTRGKQDVGEENRLVEASTGISCQQPYQGDLGGETSKNLEWWMTLHSVIPSAQTLSRTTHAQRRASCEKPVPQVLCGESDQQFPGAGGVQEGDDGNAVSSLNVAIDDYGGFRLWQEKGYGREGGARET